MKSYAEIADPSDITTKEYVDKGLEDKVSCTEQILTEDQKVQAKKNVSAASYTILRRW